MLTGLRSLGVQRLEIFLMGRRLFMWLEADEGFDLVRDFGRLNDDPRCKEWDEVMRGLQTPVAEAADEEWWARMKQVFDFEAALTDSAPA